ncbi:MAG: choice-of-anchor D domain-containing protein, partial [Sphingomonadaceae bacterium]|nr:choice-of-anchor D domain-containing protein [Sphingomonadaceae bacterium]
ALAGQSFAVTGAAFDYATATTAASLAFGNVRVGANRALNVANTVTTSAAYQDSLDVLATSANAQLGFANPGSILAGANADVTVTAAAAGSLAGNIALALTSNANGVAGLSNFGLAGQSVAVTGAAFDLASATLAAATLDLGNVRLGQGSTLAVTNAVVTAAAFQDSLDVVAASANGKLTLAAPGNILASASGNVGVTANTAGSLAGTVTLGLTSNANGVVGLENTALAGQSFAVTGAAFDYATATAASTLAFGNVRVAAGTTARNLAVTNTVTTSAAFQDSLDVTAAAALHTAVAPGNLLAGASGDVVVTASTAVAGSLADTLTLGFTSNANGLNGLSNLALAGQSVA